MKLLQPHVSVARRIGLAYVAVLNTTEIGYRKL